jgi:Fe2+ transport system protein FeoA
MSLRATPVGGTVRIGRLTGDPALRERLVELGFAPGQSVRVLRRAPLGDPVEVLVRGYRLAVRASEADLLEVEAAAPAGAAAKTGRGPAFGAPMAV